MKKYIGPILSLASVGMLFYIIYDQKQQIQDLKTIQVKAENDIRRVDSIQKVADSLDAEVFRLSIDVTRYEIAAERMGEIYIDAKKSFDYILTHETE